MKIVLLVILLLLIILLFRNIRIVPQEHAYVIERLGKFKTVWYAGLHVKIPFIDNIVNKISLKEQVFDFPPQPVITKDNVSVKVDSVVFIRSRESYRWSSEPLSYYTEKHHRRHGTRYYAFFERIDQYSDGGNTRSGH